jgi:hypothetical protein
MPAIREISAEAGFMRLYGVLVVVLVALTALMAQSDIATIVLFMTSGLGVPLVFGATGLFYALCAFPAPLLWRTGARGRVTGIVLAAAFVAGAAFGPGYFGRMQAERQAQVVRRADFIQAASSAGSSLEIHRPARSYDGTFTSEEACAEECRAVLLSGAVQWVRIIMIDDVGSRKEETSTFYRALRGGDCAVPGAAPSDTAICVVMTADTHEKAEMTIEFEKTNLDSEKIETAPLAVFKSTRSVLAHRMQGEETSEVLHQTEVMFETPYAPTIWGPQFEGLHSHSVGLIRTAQRINPITLRGVLTQLGYSNAPAAGAAPLASTPKNWRESINDGMTREMLAVLDLPQTEPFNQQQMKPIFDWIMYARAVREWTPDLIALLRRFVRDRRVRAPTFFDQIFERVPIVTTSLLPDVLDMIETDGIGRDYTPARQAAYTFQQLDPEILKPEATRILALLDRGRDVKAILLPAIGRLGVDPLPYLTPFNADITDPSPYSPSAHVIGACRADKQWAAELIDPLREALHTTTSTTRAEREHRKMILKTLENSGDHDFVKQELAKDSDLDSTRLQSRIDHDTKRDWLCNWL